MHEFITKHVSNFLRSIKSLGGEVEDLIIDGPAAEPELNEIETNLGRTLPLDLRTFALKTSRRIYFHWKLPENFELSGPLREIFGGGLDYDVSKIPQYDKGRAGWQAECFPNANNSYDVVWHNKLGFHEVPNGDYLGFDSDGRVVYLSHDDGEGHGYKMAESFSDLINRWIPLGCPGPEDWQWLPFVSSASSGILPESINAKQWLKLIERTA